MDKLTSPKIIKELQEKYDFKFSKKLGQNFLIDENIIKKIIDGADVNKDDYILEIGPGIGTLTRYLCERSKHVVIVEIDSSLIPILNDTLYQYSNKTIINNDVLKLNLKEELKKITDNQFKVVANLPYYITSEIIMNLLEGDLPLQSITVMVQKEVAQRMISSPGKKDYGALSVAVQYYSKPEIITMVPKTVFIPQPKVDSCVIKLNILKNPPVEVDKGVFFKIVKASFSMRRKTLLNCLANGLKMDKDKVKSLLIRSNIDMNRRGETLSLEEFAEIARQYNKFRGE